ncbi:neuronal cell adhesion molecule isoform X1 [Corvus moneduloides]|uniref:neuronal cell adhesion molecule isoform X1 n=1 Tax=Corvus moneduloides TaxID=1196302 RepID=UPI0013644286|nr:neuronal cell adhesion molecule isoform X1 [Corvus moneduloides]XP_031962263.1 neuronal cell adhesion molecule isoform X1 [Corvus moneduloides]XP_031962264.1 neuronal cell adhesion molecule isoform X1 [Corvus moneduloides]XP_031962265.1 neuronal cell adhesion molecule isoform X1 [Corvus moneduloides]XP_031962266.1 neuronal cell adhesion molecule isoform X1 [Corvus moneduloides]
MMKKMSIPTSKASLVLFLCQIISALDVPLDSKLLEELSQPPTITQQSPKDYIVDPRENIVIQCEAKGKPPPSFSWTRNGTHFDIDKDAQVTMKPNSGTLVVNIMNGGKAEAYEGVYQCTARNERGAAISNNIVIRPSRSPLWTKEKLEPNHVREGDSLVLHCRPPVGLPPPIIFWMDNAFQRLPQSERVSQGLNGDLYFANVQPEDTREDYICYARFNHTQTIQQKQPISVKVFSMDSLNDTIAANLSDTDIYGAKPVTERPPVLLTPTGSTSTKVELRGNVLLLECIAAGLPTPVIRWIKEGGELPANRTFFENFKKTLKIIDVSEADSGNYKCIARNTLGSVHHVISVTVKAAPYWITAPRNLVLSPGEDGTLICRANGNPKPSISWLANGVPIAIAPEDPSRKVDGDTIIFSHVQERSSAVYQCNASNEYGYLLANAFVNVLAEPPRILTPANKLYQVIADSPALLDCAYFGSPKPEIEWFKGVKGSILRGNEYVFHDNGTLEIPVAQKDSAGTYTCVARNELGKIQNEVQLEIKDPTMIIKQPEYKVIQRYGQVSFECIIKHDSTLLPTVIWLKDNDELPDDERFLVGKDNLTIMNVTDKDDGTYTCIVNTTLDSVSASAVLTVVAAPPTPAIIYARPNPPFDLELTGQLERSIELSWIPGDENNSPITNFVIEYEDALHEPGVWHYQTEVSGTQTTAQLKLSPYVNYSFRVIAVNKIGRSQPSEPSEQYLTKSASPDENPANVQGIGSEPDNLVITWEPLKGFQSNGPGLQYKVSWRQKDVDDEWTSVIVANVSKYIVSGTPTFVPYEVKVQALNDLGYAPEPSEVIGHSGEDLPMVAPGNVQVHVINSTLAKVHWDPVPLKTVRGHLQGYKVYYWKVQSLSRRSRRHVEKKILTFRGNKTFGMLPGLEPYSSYKLNVRVVNGKGEGPASPDKVFKTPEGVPSSPSFLKITNPTLDSLTLEWGSPTHPNGVLTSYTLKFQPINNTHELGPLVEIRIPANESSLILKNLNYSTRYKFYFNAQTSVGSGSQITEEAVTIMDEAGILRPAVGVGKGYSEILFATSPVMHTVRPTFYKVQSLYPRIRNVTTAAAETYANISWEYEGPDHANFYVEYGVAGSKEDWKKEIVNGSRSFFVLKGLTPGTAYKVRVGAEGLSGFRSSEDVFETGPAMASRQVDIATQGWFIGLMCAVALLILILLIVCFIRRNKGGKYPVKEKEDAHADPEIQPMKEDDGTFGEYRSMSAWTGKKLDKEKKRKGSCANSPEADPVFTKAKSVRSDRSNFFRRSGDQYSSTRSETSYTRRRARQSSELTRVSSVSASLCQEEKRSDEWKYRHGSRHHASEQQIMGSEEGSDSQAGQPSPFQQPLSCNSIGGPLARQHSSLQHWCSQTPDCSSDSEDTQSSCHRKVRPTTTTTHFSEYEKNSLMKSVILPELATVLKDALTAARQSITSVAQARSHSVKHPRVPIAEVPLVPLEASGRSSQTSESDHMDSLKDQTVSVKRKPEADKALEVESAPEDGEMASESPTEDPEEPDPLRRFDMENQNYLFEHIKRVLMLKSSKSECTSEELLIPSEEGKVDNALPIHSAVEDLVCRIWGNPEAKHEAPAVLHKLYPFPVDKVALWGTLPEVDRALVTGDSVLSVPANTDALPKDPTDRKIEEAIKRSFKLVAAQLGVSIYCTYASKALLIWLEEERVRFKKKWVPSGAMQRKRRLCKIAANFIHDAAEDSLTLTVKNVACLTVAWRALWLRPWSSSQDLKCKLLSLPYTGGKLFGESLVQIMKDFSEHKHSSRQMKKKSSVGSSSCSPHKCLSSLRSPPKFKGGKGKYKVSQSFHAKYEKTSHFQRGIRPSRGTF